LKPVGAATACVRGWTSLLPEVSTITTA
jgi:hypothetical protein